MAKNVEFKRNKGESHIDSVIDYLMSKEGSGSFPRNEEFKRCFIEYEIYNRRNLALYTLYNIEKYYHKEVVEFDELTIEHIMPKTLTPKWSIDLGKNADEIHKMYRDTIGNLTITKYNSEMSNKSFDEKKNIYMDSNIKITRDLLEYEKWDKHSIINRANNLFEIANEIWKIPVDKYGGSDKDKLKPGVEYSILESVNVTGHKPASLIIDSEEFSVTSWREMLIETCLLLIDLDSELFYSLLENKNFNKLISTNKDNFRRPEELRKGIFLEVHFSAKDILNYIQLLTKEYELEEEVYFMIK